MSTTVTYKGNTLTTVDNQTRTLLTSGKYMEDDLTLVDVSGGGGGTPTLYSNGSTFYAEDTVIDADATYAMIKKLKAATLMKSVKCLKASAYGGSNFQINTAFEGCTLLETVQLLNGMSSSGYCEDIIKDCPNIKEFITGDIGYPNDTGMGSTNWTYYTFRNIAVAFDIIIYTTATTLASVPSALKTGSPWGATNATVIYKNSVTGEVLT